MEGIKHKVAAGRGVHQRVSDQRHRLGRRMLRQEIALLARPAKTGHARIGPDVGAVAPELAKLDVVAVGRTAILEHQHQLVGRAVETAHAAVRLGPDTDVDELAIARATRRDQGEDVLPIHANVAQRAIGAGPGHQPAGLGQEDHELRLGKLAAGHHELAVAVFALAADVTVDRHVIGRVGEHQGCARLTQQPLVALRLQGAGAEDFVRTQCPEVAGLGHRRARIDWRIVAIGFIGPASQTLDLQIDLSDREAGGFQVEAEIELGEHLQVLGQQRLVPGGGLGEPVVGDGEGAGLFRGQVLQADHRDLLPSQLAAGQYPPMASQDLAAGIDQHRYIEGEGFDAARDLADLRGLVEAGVLRVEGQGGEGEVFDGKLGLAFGELGADRHWRPRITEPHQCRGTEMAETSPDPDLIEGGSGRDQSEEFIAGDHEFTMSKQIHIGLGARQYRLQETALTNGPR